MPEIDAIVLKIETVLEKHDVHLTTDRFNDLHDYIERLIAEIKENGT